MRPHAFTFTYDADHNRLSQTATVGGVTTTTAYLNDPVSGAMSEEVTTNGAPSYVDYLKAGGQIVAQRTLTLSAAAWGSANLGQFNWAGVSAGWDYFTLDHLGSVAVVTDASGNVVQHLSYDAWGRQRNANGSAAACGAITPPTARGFTNQEQVPGGCLVNLNARLYDAEIGRMMSPDPIVGSPYIAQELNRYSYVINNPLSLTDPSGLCFLGCFWKSAVFRDIFAIAVVFVFQQYEDIAERALPLQLSADQVSKIERRPIHVANEGSFRDMDDGENIGEIALLLRRAAGGGQVYSSAVLNPRGHVLSIERIIERKALPEGISLLTWCR